MKRIACWAGVLVALLAPLPALAVTAQLIPSRTSGIAPLLVHFDGVQSSHPGADPIHELAYDWSFGDPQAGVWSQSGADKNTATGPWASHVFDRAGTYTVRLTVRAPNGSTSTRTQVINVSSPDGYYVAGATTCISSSGNFSGCPNGAGQVTTSSFSTGMSHIGQGKRVLFRRGDSFSASGHSTINTPGPGTIGAFGVGAAPIVNSSHAGQVIRFSGRTPQATDWRVMDLDFRGPGSRFSIAIKGEGTTRQLLMYRISATNYHTSVSFSTSVLNYYNHTQLHDDMGLVESTIRQARGGSGGNGVYIGGNRLSLLGNVMMDATGSEHVIRLPYVGSTVISHNFLSNPAPTKHAVKLHALDATRNYSFPERDSHHFILSHNTFEGGNRVDWVATLGPQNSTSNEVVRDGIVERNYFLPSPDTQRHLIVWGSGVSVRNNVFNMDGGRGHSGVSFRRRGIEPKPQDNRAYNNTCYTRDSASSVSCVLASGAATNTTAHNNLLYAPNANNPVASQFTSGPQSHNVVVGQNPFVSGSPGSASDFRLKSGAAAIDAGTAIPWRGPDYAGGNRPTDGSGDGIAQWDLGAFELGGGGGTIPPPPAAPAAPVLLP